MMEHAKDVNAVLVHLMCFESLISSCVTAPPNVEFLQQPFFPNTHTLANTRSPDRHIADIIYKNFSISQLECSYVEIAM